MSAALSLADQEYETVLLEKGDRLGGNAWGLTTTDRGRAVRPVLEEMIGRVEGHPRIKVLKNAALESAVGSVGNFVSKIRVNGESRAVKYGIAVVATGARESRPDEYLYGQDDRVTTHLEFDARLGADEGIAAGMGSVVFIQCVGSREPRRPYCSRVCCTHSVKSAIRLKELNPAMNVYILNRDIRTYGEREDLYRKARDLGVLFIRYSLDRKPEVTRDGDGLFVSVFDPISRFPLRIEADQVVLAAAIEANDTRELVELYKCAANADGFLNEAHPKLRPVDMSVEGLFLAGMCNYPKPIDESVGMAKAAAARAGVILARKQMQLDAIKSFVTEKCDGCALCLDVCPYRALKLEEYDGEDGRTHRRVITDKALCKGCGLCEATCPKGGIYVHGFTLEQLKDQVTAALAAS